MARVLTLNVGSSSLKWSLFDETDRLVDSNSCAHDALEKIAARVGPVEAVAHRVVHGGTRFTQPTLIDHGVEHALDDLTSLDPLHMRPALAVIRSARSIFSNATHVAAFDTAFHRSLPDEASTYAVPRAWREEYGVRRYGFHGLSVSWSCERIAQLVQPVARVVVLHLGSGSSATAVLDGRSVDTTMGMTPLDGIVMSTRAGAIDAGALLHVARAGVAPHEIEDVLTTKSGIFALAGRSDMREIAELERGGDADAIRARAHLVHSIARHASSLVPSLGGLDALIFTGGIGEGDAAVRERVASQLAFLGVSLDRAKNGATTLQDGVISSESSRVIVAMIHAREDLMLLRAARQPSCDVIK
jgi:acetate kinase